VHFQGNGFYLLKGTKERGTEGATPGHEEESERWLEPSGV
jgi:hypothetical protein